MLKVKLELIRALVSERRRSSCTTRLSGLRECEGGSREQGRIFTFRPGLKKRVRKYFGSSRSRVEVLGRHLEAGIISGWGSKCGAFECHTDAPIVRG